MRFLERYGTFSCNRGEETVQLGWM